MRKKKVTVVAVVVAIALGVIGYAIAARPEKKNQPVPQTATTGTGERTILFFMNPNGRPCQMQLSILDGMSDKLKPLANIRYYKTTEDSDQQSFYQYGIRGLPSLIVIDKKGNELKRFSPGIQDADEILAALK